ncbi:MAG: NAD(P)/FAD-dependent oxidoreductase [Acidobacteriota bacterium]
MATENLHRERSFLPMRRNPDRSEVVIIGGGVIGCSIAYHLSREGLTDILLLESQALASGATGICPGGIRQQFEREADCLFAKRSIRFWEQINELLEPEDPFQFERSGYLFLADSAERMNRFAENVALQNRLGIPSTLLTPQEVGELLPALQWRSVRGGSWCGEDGFLEDCHGVTAALAQRASLRGARILYEEAIHIGRADGLWEVGTKGGTRFCCRHLVLAAGLDSVPLAAQLGLRLPVTPQLRRLAFTTPHPERVMLPLVAAPERGFAGKQLSHGVFYLGWLQETGQEDELDFLEKSLRVGASLLPILAALPVRRVLTGVYDTTPDHRPILGEIHGLDRLYVATGFSGHGFMIAPAVGEALAARITGGNTDLPLEAFSLSRFEETAPEEGLVI